MMMDSFKKCGSCGSDELFFNEADFQGYTRSLVPGVFGVFKTWEKSDVCVCGKCGYIMFFLRDDALEEVRKRWTKR